MRGQPGNIRQRVPALHHFDAEGFLQLALSILVGTGIHAGPTAGQRYGGNAIARTKNARFYHSGGDDRAQPIMAVVAKMGEARPASGRRHGVTETVGRREFAGDIEPRRSGSWASPAYRAAHRLKVQRRKICLHPWPSEGQQVRQVQCAASRPLRTCSSSSRPASNVSSSARNGAKRSATTISRGCCIARYGFTRAKRRETAYPRNFSKSKPG